MKAVSMPGLPTRVRSIVATIAAAALAVIATAPTITFALERPLADALAPGRPSCHARAYSAEEQAAHPARRVAAISIERAARDLAAERKWGAAEEMDGSPIVSATLRVRLRGDPVTYSARLACMRGFDDAAASLVCESRACDGGELRIRREGQGAIAVSIGGTLKSGRFIGHYIHLEDSCEGRAGGALVLESGEDDRVFSLAAAPKAACQ
jgi:hypothetical protein